MNRWPLFALTLAAAILWAALRIQVPTPLPHDAPADQFSAGRAMADVRSLAAEPHPTGSPAAARVVARLEQRLAGLGFVVRRVETVLPARAAERLAKRGGDATKPAISLVAVRAGADPALPAVALMAHHDSVIGSPGAADDIAGVAAALEIARAIPRVAQRRDLVLIFTDAEEQGLVGARALYAPGAAADAIAAHTGVLINLEARGGGGRAMMFQTGPDNANLVRLLAATTPAAAASSIAVTIYESLPNNTDFTPVLERGIAGLNFAFIGEAHAYHSPLSTPDTLEQGAVQHLGDSVLGITRALLAADALPAPAPNAVFATAPLLGLIVYPPESGWALVGASLLLLGLAAWWRRRDWSLSGTFMAFGQALLTLIIAAVLMWGLNLLSGSVGAEYYDRLAALPRLELVAGLAALAALLFMASAPAGTAWDRWIVLAKLPFVAALAVQIWLPAAGPIFAWPALLAAIGLAWGARPGASGVAAMAPALLLAIPGLTLTAELAHFAFLGVGAPLPFVTVPLLIPALALLAPAIPAGPRVPALIGAAVAVALAAGVALWVNLDPPAPSIPPYAGDEKSQG
ncbi:MAG: M20/M25/M40 family metallo-hydrolase [Alphaproteobacteria bacterium]|nr:M20/M25/M40 family metallo-hydrolase [Alphaproteobacteria bacterium]